MTTTTTTTMPTPPMPNCQDNNRYCSYWASRGECTRNPSYMNRNCQRACNRCDNEESDCRDMNSNCPNWTSFCNNDIYRDYLANNCALSCGVCTANDVSSFSVGSCLATQDWYKYGMIMSIQQCIISEFPDILSECYRIKF